MDFSKLLHGLVKIETLISLSCYLDLSKLLHVFLKVLHGFVKIFLCISRPLPNKTKLKFDPKIYWSFCFKIKVLNKSKYSMPWGRCSFGKVFFSSSVSSDTFRTKYVPMHFTPWLYLDSPSLPMMHLQCVHSHFQPVASGCCRHQRRPRWKANLYAHQIWTEVWYSFCSNNMNQSSSCK